MVRVGPIRMARLEKNFDRIHAKDSNRWSTVSKRSVLPMIRKEEQMKNIRLFFSDPAFRNGSYCRRTDR